ncbi:hypothetical protein ACFOZ7_20415 [Natribaculum luteum]|uniref:DUF7344 domain-containing protein n=1 Tax=Natribaculum luteum TaxID=1586232 RepID=A0ABD5P4R6_9EURY|nr:ArsR family transcriptional regulator [Natribaculum luteum]
MGGEAMASAEQTTEADESTPPDGESLSRDTVFQTLSNRRRRRALRYLIQHRNDETVRMRDLSEWIAAEENGVSRGQVTYKQRKRVYTSLYQSHLPALHRDGIVDYDRARGTVSLTPVATEFDTYLETTSENDRSWSTYWLGLGVTAVTVSVVALLGVVPALSRTSHLLAVAISLALFASAVVFASVGGRDSS